MLIIQLYLASRSKADCETLTSNHKVELAALRSQILGLEECLKDEAEKVALKCSSEDQLQSKVSEDQASNNAAVH